MHQRCIGLLGTMVLRESFFVRGIGLGGGGGWIDPGGLGDGCRSRWAFDEAFGVGGVGGLEDDLASLADLIRLTVVEHGRGEQADAGVVVVVVVPSEEATAEAQGVLVALEAVREFGNVFEGFELAFGERVVIGHMGPAVGFGDAQGAEQLGDGLRNHGRPPIAVEGQLLLVDLLTLHGVSNQTSGQVLGLTMGEHPADDVAAEDVQDHVEVVGQAARVGRQSGELLEARL